MNALYRYETITRDEVIQAQDQWAKAVINQDVESLLGLYEFNNSDKPLLFKPTLSDSVRTDEEGTLSYFIGGNPRYPDDKGFLKHGWKEVKFHSTFGPILFPDNMGAKDMGQYDFVNAEGQVTDADYTFIYRKANGKVLITLHHSSLTWHPDEISDEE